MSYPAADTSKIRPQETGDCFRRTGAPLKIIYQLRQQLNKSK
jgi:hypothetical protein